MEGLVLPDIYTIVVAAFGGLVMGWAMFRLLPGMRMDAYSPREWIPVSIYLTSLGWFTYFVPQFVLMDLTSFAQQFLYGGIVFTTYMVALVAMLLICQIKKNRKE